MTNVNSIFVLERADYENAGLVSSPKPEESLRFRLNICRKFECSEDF
jgi:hypothetical protein